MDRRSRFKCDDVDQADGERRPIASLRVDSAPDIYAVGEIPTPTERRLSIFAFDPGRGHYVGNFMTASVRYEELEPGPIGERFAVIDYDGSQNTFYAPVDLNDPKLLAQGGLAPNEADPRFHQQMVYAVASETLQRFEYALGRKVHWAATKPHGATHRLNLFPHAMCEANAFYSPAAHGILFGYFKASRTNPGPNLPGQTVFTCLSHDIIVHETTHAIVDGIRSYFTEPTNVDVPAFHEAFADVAALFSHFSHRDVLLDALQKTGGQLFNFTLAPEAPGGAPIDGATPSIQAQARQENPLINLALQFGQASGLHAGLRSALQVAPNQRDITVKTEPHERGAILVAAIFDAYFSTYLRRTSDLFRIYRAGGRVLGDDLPDPLAERLAETASRTADQFFVICARALDYCPPVDITFGDYLRAVLTADLDFHPEDADGLRPALIQAFHARGIVANDAFSLTEESLFWPKVACRKLPNVDGLVFGDPNGLTKKEKDKNGDVLRAYAKANAAKLGFNPAAGPISAPSFHPMFHMAADGSLYVDMVVELVQTVRVPIDGETGATFPMRNGVTLLIAQDPAVDEQRPAPRVRFAIRKLHTREREDRIRNYYLSTGRAFPMAADGEADDSRFHIDFGLLHAGV